jgi:drug/metabolite transporter (DMT)-like permease
MRLTHPQAVLLMIAVTAMWSIAGLVTRHLDSARGFEVTFWRSVFTTLSLLVLLPLMQGRQVFARMLGAGRLLWLSGLCWSVMFTAFMMALSLTTVANVLITLSIGPLFTALVARWTLQHPIAGRTWMAIAVAGAGIAWMFADQLGGEGLLGSLVALAVPLAAAAHWTIVQHASQRGLQIDLVPAVLVGAFLSALYTWPLAWPLSASAHDLQLLALLGLVQLAIPCALAVMCARVLQAPEVSLLGLLEVIFGIALAWWGAQEVPQPRVLQGGLLVLLALAGNEWLGWRQRQHLQTKESS